MPPEGLPPINCKQQEHKGWKFIQKRNKKIWDSYYKFTIERNSWDKVVSLYHWQKKTEPQHNITDFTTYIKYKKNLYNKKDWLLYTDQNKLKVDFVIRFENLNDDFKYVCSNLGMPYSDNLKSIQLKSTIRKNKSYRDFYTDETKDIVSNVYSNEINFFNYIF